MLGFFNTLNALFQSKKPLIHELHIESVKFFMRIGQNFIKREALAVNVNIRSPHSYLSIEEIYYGAECNELLKTIPITASNRIKLDCLEFYIIALEEMQVRLPLKDDCIFKEITFLNPMKALGSVDLQGRNNIQFTKICELMKINKSKLLEEWRGFEYNFTMEEKKSLECESVEKFWHRINKMKNFNDEKVFPILSNLSAHLLCLPHANADAERIFSIVTDVRTKKRNKLSNEVLNSICIIRTALQNSETNCITFECSNHN